MSSARASMLAAPSSYMSLLLLCLASSAYAHGGHMDEIPEGAAVSEDPIVRFTKRIHYYALSN